MKANDCCFLGMAAAYAVVLILFLNEVKKPDYKKNYIITKTVQSMAFLIVFFTSAGISHNIKSFWLMLPAFVCCFAGDVFLAFYNKFRKKKIFLTGLSAFLMGHLFFIRWLNRMQKFSVVDLLFPVAAVIAIGILTGTKNFHTGRLRPCILLYSFFIGYLFGKSAHIAVCMPDLYHMICAVGSFLFMISDISILFLYFYKSKDRRIHVFNLATYYIGIFFLAVSLLFL